MSRFLIVDTFDASLFTDEELATAPVHPKRRLGWLLARTAAKQLALSRGLCTDPRTFIVQRSPTLSLAHSGRYGAVAIEDTPVGIDIEVIREVNERAAHLFLSTEEEQAMCQCAIEHRLLHFWCAKEAAFKQGNYTTLKRVSLVLIRERHDGLDFDRAETTVQGELIVALTSPL